MVLYYKRPRYGTLGNHRSLDYASRQIYDSRLVVISDSQYALEAIAKGQGSGLKRAQIAQIHRLLKALDQKEVHTNFRWVPARSGVEGNERADKEAKEISHA